MGVRSALTLEECWWPSLYWIDVKVPIWLRVHFQDDLNCSQQGRSPQMRGVGLAKASE